MIIFKNLINQMWLPLAKMSNEEFNFELTNCMKEYNHCFALSENIIKQILTTNIQHTLFTSFLFFLLVGIRTLFNSSFISGKNEENTTAVLGCLCQKLRIFDEISGLKGGRDDYEVNRTHRTLRDKVEVGLYKIYQVNKGRTILTVHRQNLEAVIPLIQFDFLTLNFSSFKMQLLYLRFQRNNYDFFGTEQNHKRR